MRKTKFLLFCVFILNQHLFSQSNFYLYTSKNILPDDSVRVYINGYNLKSNKVALEVYRFENPEELLKSEYDIFNFNDSAFFKLSNNLKLVLSTYKFLRENRNWFSENFYIGNVNSRGTYVVKGKVDDFTAYSLFTCSEDGIIAKRSTKEVIIYLSNRITSQPVINAKLKLFSLDKKSYVLESDKNGIGKIELDDRPENRRLFVVSHVNDTTILHLEPIYSPSDEYDKFLVYTFTNQPVYRPRQIVHFKSIIREKDGDELKIPTLLSPRIKVIMPDNSFLLDSIILPSSFGSIAGSFEIPDEAPIGIYTISIELNGLNFHTSFFVEEFKKPEYKINIFTDKDSYGFNDSIKIKVNAEYFFGEPLLSGKVRLLIYRKPIVRYWWEFEPYVNFYRGCFLDIIPIFNPELIYTKEGELKDGIFEDLFIDNSKIDQNFEYQVVAYVKDQSNREVSGSKNILVTVSNIQVVTFPDRYFYPPNSNVIIKVSTKDFALKPVSRNFKILIQKIHTINFTDYYEDIDTVFGETQKDGIAYVSYSTSYIGHYSYLVIVEDGNTKITRRGNFYVIDGLSKISGIREGLQIIPAKEIFSENEDIEFLIISPVNDVNIFTTLEQSKIYDHRIIKLSGNTAVVRFKNNLSAITHIFAGFYYDNQYFSQLKRIGILKDQQKLNIQIVSDKKEYKPGDDGKFIIKVKDSAGKPVENVELSSSIIDESIFSIKPESSKNIYDVFSQSATYKIISNHTELDNYSPIFPLESNQYKIKSDRKSKGSAIVTGILKNGKTEKPIDEAEIVLFNKSEIIRTMTDKNGQFKFTAVPVGKYDLIINHYRYENKILKSISVKIFGKVDLGEIYIFPLDENMIETRTIFNKMRILKKDSQEFVIPETEMDKSLVGISPDEFIEPVIRKDFRDAIYWNPVLITDENGEAEVLVKFPDNLTSWRNTIKAITIDSKVGEESANVIVRKNILVRVETPRYVHENDELTIPVMIHNYTRKDQRIRVEVLLENGKIISDIDERMHHRIINTDEFIIKPDSFLTIHCRIKVGAESDTLKIIAKALTIKSNDIEAESDAVEVKIPVESSGIPEIIVNNFSLSKKFEKYSTRIFLDKEKRNYKIILNLSPTLLGNILSSLDELVGYPYGCVEQTMSRFLPSIIVANLIDELNLSLKIKTLNELPKIIQTGLKRLGDFQHDDGGWGWWKEDQTNPYMTAYVMYGLTLTKKAGYNPDNKMFLSGLNALRRLLKEYDNDENIKAYLLYSFNHAIEFSDEINSDIDLLLKKFNELFQSTKNPYVLSLILEIAHKNNMMRESKEIKQKLLRSANVVGNLVYWGNDLFYSKLSNDAVEITSHALKSLIMTGEKSNLIENAIRWLLNKKKGNFWFSTKQTASVIFSLVEYLKITDELVGDFEVKLKINGKEIHSYKIDKSSITVGEIKYVIPSKLLSYGENIIEIEKIGKGKLYCSIVEKHYGDSPRKNEYFEVERTYYLLKYEQEGNKLINKISKLKDKVRVGDRILVEIKVRSKRDFEYLMIEDPIVPGFERLSDNIGDANFYNRWNYQKEERDKKTAFFVTNFKKGEMKFSYITYAQIPGMFKVPPTMVSLMYYPDINSTGEENSIIILGE